jgi:hypothetical protein
VKCMIVVVTPVRYAAIVAVVWECSLVIVRTSLRISGTPADE